jgi:sulfur carrier protein
VKATINGHLRDLPDELSVSALLDLLGSPRAGIGGSLHHLVVPPTKHDSDRLRDGDRVEIITAVAGG